MLDQQTTEKALTAATLAILALYLLTAWVVLPAGAFWSPDEGVKWLQLQNLRLEDGQFHFDIQYAGREIDPDLEYVSTVGRLIVLREGKLYLPRLPVFPLLSLPAFRLLGFKGLYLLPALAGALSCACMLALVWPNAKWATMGLLIAFGSPIFIYSVLFWEHTPATCLCLLATWLALRAMSGQKRRAWAGAGLLLGLAFYLRPETALYAAALALACACIAWRERRGIAGPVVLGIALAVVIAPYLPVQRVLFPYVYRPLTYIRQGGWRAIPYFLLGPPSDEGMDFGFWGLLFSGLALSAIALSLVSALSPESRRWRWMYWLSLGGVAVLSGSFLFSPNHYRSTHGFLLSTPWALLGVCRAPDVWRRGDLRARALTLTALFGLGAYAAGILLLRGSSPHGGLEWGARFALTLYPLLAIMALWPFAPVDRHAVTFIIWTVFLCLGIGFQLRGLRTIRADKILSAAWNQELAASPEDVIVSDVWWLPLSNAPGYYDKPIFIIRDASQLDQWATEGVDTFCLATFDPSQTLLQLQQNSASLHPLRWISIANLQFIGVEIRPTSGRP